MSVQNIFFSYSRIDGSDFALRLGLDIKKQGFDVWIDQEDIRAGSEWDIEIEKALDKCDAVLFIETEKSVVSTNVLDEVYYALEQQKKVIPLVLFDSKTPLRLKRLQHIDFTKNYDTGLALLLAELTSNAAAVTYHPEDIKPLVRVREPFYKKYAGLILVLSLIVVIGAAIFIYLINNKQLPVSENLNPVTSKDSVLNNQPLVNTKQEATAEKNSVSLERIDDGPATPKQTDKKARTNIKQPTNNTATETVNDAGAKTSNLQETFAGDWELAGVEPKAEAIKGYLKITASDDAKASIKSYMQFYYRKTNDTSYLTVFNAFAGCTFCVLSKDMKLTAEDVAIGSQLYRILKHDQPDGGKAGDTIMQAGANKSIRASVTLQLVNNTTAVIKVQRTSAAELSHGLVLKPFVYVFRFTRVD